MTQRYSSSTPEIKKYLFHELSLSEREKLEERLFEDDNFFYEVLTVENDLVDLYALDKLEGAELERFERSMRASPGRREKVATALALQRWIAEARQPELMQEEGIAVVGGELPLWKRFTTFTSSRSAAFQFAAAALFILLTAGMVFLLIERGQVRQELAHLRESKRNDEGQRQEQILQERLKAAQEREEELKRQLETERGEAMATREQLQRAMSKREQAERDLEELRHKQSSPKQNSPTRLYPTAVAQVYLEPFTGSMRSSIAEKVMESDVGSIIINLKLDAGSDLKQPLSVEINGKKEPIEVQLHSLSSRIIIGSINIARRKVVNGMNTIILKNADNDEIGSYRLIIKKQ